MATSRRLTWLITGCSSGFGYELVIEALARGDRVIATARNGPARLGDLQAKGAVVLDLDVTWPQDRIATVIQEAESRYDGGIDVLVNNAGYVQLGIMEEIPLAQIQASLETNTFGVLKILRAVLPQWRARKSGTHVVISSLFGFTGGAASTADSASKFGLEGIVESGAQELSPFNIETIIFEPGWFRTEMANPTNIRLAQGDMTDYTQVRAGINGYAAHVHGSQPGDPRKAAQRIVDVVRREGIAHGQTSVPLRLPLGPDGFEAVRKKCTETLQALDAWEKVLADTNVDG